MSFEETPFEEGLKAAYQDFLSNNKNNI